MLSRRELVGKIAAGTAVLLASGSARASLRPVMPETTTATGAGRGFAGETNAFTGSGRPEGPITSVPNPPLSGAPSEMSFATETPVATEMSIATLSAPPPWDLIRPLHLGSAVGFGWHVANLTGTVDGSAVLTLENKRGRSHRVHICRNDGDPQGLVHTRRFDLVVMNGGRGDLPTEESFAHAVAEIAHVLATRENDRRQAPVLAALMPQSERLRRFAGPADARLR
jgi:hypothetical protein